MEQIYYKLIKAGPDDDSKSPPPGVAYALECITHFLRQDSKVTMYHKGEFHKFFIYFSPKLGFQFAVRQNSLYQKLDFTVPLPDFKKINNTSLRQYTLPWTLHHWFFLKPSTTSENAPSLHYVSAKNLLSPCPHSLMKSLDPSNPDRQVWIDSNNKGEKS